MAEKKKLQHFLSDMLKLSCVKGFKHFATHMRGREEMVCSIVNEPSMPIIQSATNSPATSFGHHKREAFPMSHKQQRRLSGYGFINVGLPPASPSENEEEDDNQTMFLIAGYSRYNRPYVWPLYTVEPHKSEMKTLNYISTLVRTNHERLVRLTSEEEKDYPLLLQTTSQWQEKDVKVWDVLTELVEVCTTPCPPNPFAVDFDFFESLQLPERALASAAMIAFLQKLIASGPHSYDRRIHSDVGKISRIHFRAMLRLLQEGIIPPPTSSSSSSLPHHHHQSSQPATQHTHTQEEPISTAPSRATLPSSEPAPLHSTLTSSTPAPYGTGMGSTSVHPPPHPHPHDHMQPPAATPHMPAGLFHPPPASVGSVAPQSSGAHGTSGGSGSGGQFYSRRMGGSYNY